MEIDDWLKLCDNHNVWISTADRIHSEIIDADHFSYERIHIINDLARDIDWQSSGQLHFIVNYNGFSIKPYIKLKYGKGYKRIDLI